jgi:hypothetical protein
MAVAHQLDFWKIFCIIELENKWEVRYEI